MLIVGFIFSKNFRQGWISDDQGIEILNQVLPRKFQILRKNKSKSIEIWKKLINSDSEARNKLNSWLQDTNRLKSNYKVDVKEEKITWIERFGYWLASLLNLEERLYDVKQYKSWQADKDIIDKMSEYLNNGLIAVSSFIENKLGLASYFRKQLIFKDISKDTDVTPRDMGLGISQALPILISTLSSKNTNIYLEQPELHLHPAVQMELVDELIRSYHENNNFFMLESHSEHMLLRIMKRMRHTAENKDGRDKSLDLTPDDVCLLYVDNNGKTTYIKELELDNDGTLLDPWPNGFFEEGHNERFE